MRREVKICDRCNQYGKIKPVKIVNSHPLSNRIITYWICDACIQELRGEKIRVIIIKKEVLR